MKKIIEKLKKLVAHEKSARLLGNIAEADSFAAAIKALREKHRIFDEIVPDHEAQQNAMNGYNAELVFDHASPHFRRKRIYWEEVVFIAVCGFFECRSLVFRGTNLKVVIGEKRNRERVKKSYLFVTEHARSEAKRYLEWRLERESSDAPERRIIKDSFFHGFAAGFFELLKKLKEVESEVNRLRESENQPSEALAYAGCSLSQERRAEVEKDLENVKAAPEPKVQKIDEEAVENGFYSGVNSKLTDEIALPAKNNLEELQEIQTRQEKERRFEEMRYRARYGRPARRSFSSERRAKTRILAERFL